MARVSRLLIRCYPAAWRARYWDEFQALLAERPLGPFDVADVLLGAFDARIHLRGLSTSTTGRGFVMSLRLGGLAAIAGAVMWALVFALDFVTTSDDLGVIGGSLLMLGSIGFLVALVGLSAFQARRHPVLVWAGFIVPALGCVLTIVGMVLSVTGDSDREIIGGASAWGLWFLGIIGILVGSGIFALTTYLTAALSRMAAGLLGIGSIGAVVAGIVDSGSGGDSNQTVLLV
ncbi:MAG: hypothetical protein ABIZ34_01660, partial [Candidatus Limnocylindrales bacterium]